MERWRVSGPAELRTPSFGGGDGVVVGDFPALALGLDGSGRLLTADGYGGGLEIARFATDGTLDPTFDPSGTGIKVDPSSDAGGSAIGVGSDGRITVAGSIYVGGETEFGFGIGGTSGAMAQLRRIRTATGSPTRSTTVRRWRIRVRRTPMVTVRAMRVTRHRTATRRRIRIPTAIKIRLRGLTPTVTGCPMPRIPARRSPQRRRTAARPLRL